MRMTLFLFIVLFSLHLRGESRREDPLVKLCDKFVSKLDAVQGRGQATCSAQAASSITNECDRLKLQSEWSVKQSGVFVRQCELSESKLEIVKRHDLEAKDRVEPELRTGSAPAGTWGACPPKEPVCDDKNFPDWSNQLKAISELHRQMHRARCVKPYKPEQEVAQLREKFLSLPQPKCSPPLGDQPTDIVIHHTAFPQNYGPEEIQYAHMYSIQTWSDCGYHYIISPDKDGHWRAHECRAQYTTTDPTGKTTRKLITGAHVGPGLNSDSIGIVIAGNYGEGGDNPGQLPGFGESRSFKPPPPEAVEVLMKLTKELKQEYPSLTHVKSHRQAKADHIGCGKDCGKCDTLCPGPACVHFPKLLENRIAH